MPRKPSSPVPPRYRKPRSMRISMGELQYFALSFHHLMKYALSEQKPYQEYVTDIQAHCPTLFEIMNAWSTVATTPPEWDTLTFTWKIPLPAAFDEDEKRREDEQRVREVKP